MTERTVGIFRYFGEKLYSRAEDYVTRDAIHLDRGRDSSIVSNCSLFIQSSPATIITNCSPFIIGKLPPPPTLGFIKSTSLHHWQPKSLASQPPSNSRPNTFHQNCHPRAIPARINIFTTAYKLNP